MIAHGKVYVATTNGIGVFGLLGLPAQPDVTQATHEGAK